MVKNITGKKDFISFLMGKKATFMLASSNSATADIDGITQAGIPGMISLTPTLDSEFLSVGEVRSLKDIATTPNGVPSPALITRAIHLLKPFGDIEILNLGLKQTPKLDYFKIHSFDIDPSGSIYDDTQSLPAQEIFTKAIEFAQTYEPRGDYVILGESVPSGTTTALATALALGYDVGDKFSSSFKNSPEDIKKVVVTKALSKIDENDDIFDILSKVSDNMIVFLSGFILGLDGKLPLVLAGGTQMACVLLVVNKILQTMQGSIDSSNLALATTSWIVGDKNSDIQGLIEMCDFEINSYYSDFDFGLSDNQILKLYDDGEAKEGVGAGGALVYSDINGLTKSQITQKIEELLVV